RIARRGLLSAVFGKVTRSFLHFCMTCMVCMICMVSIPCIDWNVLHDLHGFYVLHGLNDLHDSPERRHPANHAQPKNHANHALHAAARAGRKARPRAFPIGRARGLLALQLAVEKEYGGQLHQVAEAEVDHVQGADPVQGKGALAVGKDGRPQQQKQQQPVGGIGGGVRFQPDGLPALVPPVLGLLEGFQDVEPQGGRQGAEKAEQEKGLFRHGVSSLCAKTWSMETPKASAILNASSSDGVYLYFSIEMTACREMPTRSARSAWVQSRSARRTLRRFSIKVTAPFQNVMGGLHLHCNTCVTFCQERHTKSPCIPKRTQGFAAARVRRGGPGNSAPRPPGRRRWRGRRGGAPALPQRRASPGP